MYIMSGQAIACSTDKHNKRERIENRVEQNERRARQPGKREREREEGKYLMRMNERRDLPEKEP
jgi:hypothetical protein